MKNKIKKFLSIDSRLLVITSICVFLMTAQNIVDVGSGTSFIDIKKSVQIDVPEDLVVTVSTDKRNYSLGDPVSIEIKVTNVGDEDLTVEFPDDQLADFSVTNETGVQTYLWSHGKGFPDVITPLTIYKGETVKLLNDNWYQVDFVDNPVGAGNYRIDGWMSKYYWNGDIVYPETHGTPINIKITMEIKVIDFNSLFQLFLEQHPCLFPILRQLLRL